MAEAPAKWTELSRRFEETELKQYLQFYIDGKWTDPAVPLLQDVIDPSTEEAFARVSMGGACDVDSAVQAAQRAFESFSRSSKQERIQLLEQVLAEYQKRHDDIAAAISQEVGAPLWLSKAAQAAMGTAHLKQTLRVLKSFEFQQLQRNTAIRYEPVGVVAMITPWNWPINQIMCKVAPALAAGCTMILKPSELSPVNAILLAEVLHTAGVPAGVFNLVNGDGPGVGAAMASHPGVDMVTFTGSTRGGIAVAQAAAPTVKRVAQELGGKSANIILDDADLEAAVKQGIHACFVNSGQSCNAPTRMFVSRAQHARAAEIARNVAARVQVASADSDGARHLGPVISQSQFDRIQALIQKGIDEGAELVTGGLGKPEGMDKGYFVKPTVFAGVKPEMTIAREEIFGPVLAILPYDTEEDAIRMANDSPYGLSGYVQSGSLERAREVASRLRTGMVHLNGAGPDVSAPFGGFKQSGNGREWGEHGFKDFLEVKAIMGYQPDS